MVTGPLLNKGNGVSAPTAFVPSGFRPGQWQCIGTVFRATPKPATPDAIAKASADNKRVPDDKVLLEFLAIGDDDQGHWVKVAVFDQLGVRVDQALGRTVLLTYQKSKKSGWMDVIGCAFADEVSS